MTLYGGIKFFIYLVIAMIPAVVMGIKEKKIKYYNFILNIFFILLILNNDYKQILCLLSYALFELSLVKIYILLRQKIGKNQTIYRHAVFFSILPLIVCKISGVIGTTVFGFIGISYLTFKTAQIIIEIYDGVIKDIDYIDFLIFLLFFPTISSGPIDRSRRFLEDCENAPSKKEYIELLGNGVQKILIGILYKFILSSICNYIIVNYLGGSYRLQYLILYAYTYGFYLFFDFAGYSLMAIGTSYILGIRTPDNFNKPFISISINDFWNRWHISLSHWFRDFIFTRFMLDSIKNKRFSSKLTTAFAGFMVNMTIMGIWHGFTKYYVFYGIYHGLLLGISEIYHKKSKFYKKYKDCKVYKVASWFLTINLVMFGFLIFSGKMDAIIYKYMINLPILY